MTDPESRVGRRGHARAEVDPSLLLHSPSSTGPNQKRVDVYGNGMTTTMDEGNVIGVEG